MFDIDFLNYNIQMLSMEKTNKQKTKPNQKETCFVYH